MTAILSSVGVLHVLPDPPGPVRPAGDGVRAGPARAAADPGGARLGRVSPEERERTAYHESGHALLGMLTPGAEPSPQDLRHPHGQALGVTYQAPRPTGTTTPPPTCAACSASGQQGPGGTPRARAPAVRAVA